MSFDEEARVPQGVNRQEGEPSSNAATPGRWSPRPRKVALRLVLLGCAYLVWGALALLAVSFRAYNGSSSETLYEVNPGPVRVILALLSVAVLVSTASLWWRVAHRSTKVGLAGMLVGCMVGLVAVLGMLTIGPFLLPLAALLIVLALPLAPSAGEYSRNLGNRSPAAWYPNPTERHDLRYWDGVAWSPYVTTAGRISTDPV